MRKELNTTRMEIAACLINITDISNKETSKTKPRQEKGTVREEH